jgi:pilus assembly protein CpaD
MSNRSSRIAALALLIAGGITACAGRPEAPADANLASPTDRHKILVMQGAEKLEIAVERGDPNLDEPSKQRLLAFARGFIRHGHGALVLSTPSGSPNADSAARLAQAVRLQLASVGVPFAAVAGSTYDAKDSADADAAPIILTYTRFDAQAPDCAPLWSQDLSNVSTNGPWSSFGCAVQANLAAMIDDPADLLGPRTEDSRDAGRRAVVIDAFRKGQQTHANRSDDERVSVSNAIQ